MSLLVATQVSAVATAVLAAFAIVTAAFAILAFRKQSTEVSTLQGQAKDQSEQLGLQRSQLDEQRKVNEKQASVLELQAQELRESLDERKRQAEEQRKSQATKVTAWLDRPHTSDPALAVVVGWGARIRNASDQPIFDVRAFFHYVAEKWDHGDWEPRMLGGPVEKVRLLPPQEIVSLISQSRSGATRLTWTRAPVSSASSSPTPVASIGNATPVVHCSPVHDLSPRSDGP